MDMQIIMTFVIIGVPAKKFGEDNKVLPKFCDVCPNHDFLYFTDKTKKFSEVLG